MSTPECVLGSDDAEIARLQTQAAIIAEPTALLLQRGGIRPGMRVLDLGSGPAMSLFQVAEMVGPDGYVVGVVRAGGPEYASHAISVPYLLQCRMGAFCARWGANNGCGFRSSASAVPACHIGTRLIARSSVVAAGSDTRQLRSMSVAESRPVVHTL